MSRELAPGTPLAASAIAQRAGALRLALEHLGSILEKALDKFYIPLPGCNGTISRGLE